MRARSAPTGRWEGWEVIRGSSLKPKVAGPSMLGIGCPDRHALSLTPFHCRLKCTDRDARHPAKAGSFLGGYRTSAHTPSGDKFAVVSSHRQRFGRPGGHGPFFAGIVDRHRSGLPSLGQISAQVSRRA